MLKTNTQIVEEYIEVVINQKHFDRTFDYCSRDCVMRLAPYVGLGMNSNDSNNERIIISEIAQNGPAAGKLHINDEIIRVKDSEKTWETFQELKTGGFGWGQGVVGTDITITVKRDGKELDISLKRGRVEGFDIKLADHIKEWEDYTLKYWPDLKSEVHLVCEEGNLVAFFLINSGTNLEYNRSAVWDECDFYKIKEGKIIEMWGVENQVSEFKQLGYTITQPSK